MDDGKSEFLWIKEIYRYQPNEAHRYRMELNSSWSRIKINDDQTGRGKQNPVEWGKTFTRLKSDFYQKNW